MISSIFFQILLCWYLQRLCWILQPSRLFSFKPRATVCASEFFFDDNNFFIFFCFYLNIFLSDRPQKKCNASHFKSAIVFIVLSIKSRHNTSWQIMRQRLLEVIHHGMDEISVGLFKPCCCQLNYRIPCNCR